VTSGGGTSTTQKSSLFASRPMCSCGRDCVELGNDLCRYCRADYEERQYHREQEAAYYSEQQAEYEAWLNQQGPAS